MAHEQSQGDLALGWIACLIVLGGALVVLALAGACDKPDCAALADHVALVESASVEPGARDDVQRGMRFLHEDACKKGQYTATQADCLMKSMRAGDVERCLGLASASAASSAESSPPPPATRPAAGAASDAEALAELTRLLRALASAASTAVMHGCLEAPDRLHDSLEELDGEAKQLRTWVRDPKLRGPLETALRERKDAGLVAALEKLDTAAADCPEVAKASTAAIGKWLSPR